MINKEHQDAEHPTNIRTHPGRWVADLFGRITGWIAKAFWSLSLYVIYGILLLGGILLLTLLVGVFNSKPSILVTDAKPPTTTLPIAERIPLGSFAAYTLPYRLIGQEDDNYIKLQYLGKGELQDVELTLKVTSSNTEVLEFKQFRGIWRTNEELLIIVPVALSIERIEMQGSGSRNDQYVTIRCLWFFDNLASTTTPASAILTVRGDEFSDVESPYQRLNRLKQTFRPTKQFVAQMMLMRGVDERVVWAHLKTGLFITEADKAVHPPEDIAKWDAACQAYDEATPEARKYLFHVGVFIEDLEPKKE